MSNKNIVSKTIKQKIFYSLFFDKIVNEIFQSIDENVNVTIKYVTINVDNENRVRWIIVVHINKIEIIYIFKEFDNDKTIFVDDDRVRDIFWIKRFRKILRIWLKLYICNLLNKLIEQLNKYLIDNRRNNDLNNWIKIACHDWQLKVDLIVVYNFFDKRFANICRIRVAKLIKLIELIFRRAQICNKRIIECFELVE